MNHRSANGQGAAGRQRWDTYQRNLLARDTGRGMAAGGAVLGLLSSVLPWYRVTGMLAVKCPRGAVACHSIVLRDSVNGWHGWGYLALLAFLGAGALELAPVVGIPPPSVLAGLPRRVTEPRLLLGAGTLAAVATLLFVLTGASGLGVGVVSGGAAIGAWIAGACGVLIAVGGDLLRRQRAGVVGHTHSQRETVGFP